MRYRFQDQPQLDQVVISRARRMFAPGGLMRDVVDSPERWAAIPMAYRRKLLLHLTALAALYRMGVELRRLVVRTRTGE